MPLFAATAAAAAAADDEAEAEAEDEDEDLASFDNMGTLKSTGTLKS
jgi:hypothetical protein